jgi:hypothetical protein
MTSNDKSVKRRFSKGVIPEALKRYREAAPDVTISEAAFRGRVRRGKSAIELEALDLCAQVQLEREQETSKGKKKYRKKMQKVQQLKQKQEAES